MQILLEGKDVQECVQTEFKEDDFNEEKKMLEAQKKDQKCRSYIVQCLDDAQIDFIRDKSTAYNMWQTLEERYEKKGPPGQLRLRRNLMSMKLKEMDGLEVFLAEFD